MSRILIAVGGSGQHVMLSYLRLARLCGFSPARLATVDADLRVGRQNADKTTAQLIEEQAKVSFPGPVQLATLSPLPQGLVAPNVQTFEELIHPAPGFESELLRALFSQSQRSVKVVNGFHGHPQVAATTFKMMLREPVPQNDPSHLLACLEQWVGEGDGSIDVVLAGSTFGGTGSGVMPVLALHLRAMAQRLGVRMRIGGVIQVRWFDLTLPDGAAPAEPARADVRTSDLDRNSSCLVEYYRSNLGQLFDRAYLVGHHPHATRMTAGDERQPEHPHAVNLLSGHLAYRLLHSGALDQAGQLLGVATPDSNLESWLEVEGYPLSAHIRATGAHLALAIAVQNVLRAGPPGLDVVSPYPRIIHELVRCCGGQWEADASGSGSPARHEPELTWSRLTEREVDSLRWLCAVREASRDIGACQFPEKLVPSSHEIGRLHVHERQLLPAPLHVVFHRVLSSVSRSALGEGTPERMVANAFFETRRALERECR